MYASVHTYALVRQMSLPYVVIRCLTKSHCSIVFGVLVHKNTVVRIRSFRMKRSNTVQIKLVTGRCVYANLHLQFPE